MTFIPLTPESVEIISSVIPSAKYESPGSGLMLAKGRTATLLGSSCSAGLLCSFSQGSTIWYTSSGALTFFTDLVPRLLSGRLNFFFFQAEDGIRAGRVTGVQTCALPI